MIEELVETRTLAPVEPPIRQTDPDILADEQLPPLRRENRIRLLAQSPNRLLLYWSLADDPFATLRRAFGNRAERYTLVSRLVNLRTGKESFAFAPAEGSWWFDVAAGSAYRVDIGLAAANRPFIRLISSNTANTPRPSPSLRSDTASDWRTAAKDFGRVLDASGYAGDALPFALNFGDTATAENATITLIGQISDAPVVIPESVDLEEVRRALALLSFGATPETVQTLVSAATFSFLRRIFADDLSAFDADIIQTLIKENFGVDLATELGFLGHYFEQPSEAVYGASAVHFPTARFSKPTITRFFKPILPSSNQ